MKAHGTAWFVAGLGIVAACAFSDVFRAEGVRDVRFEWASDTLLTIGVAVPVRVNVLVDGVAAPALLVTITIPDTTVVTFGVTHDSIVGKRAGHGDVVAQVQSSLSSAVDSAFRLRVRP